MWQRERNVDTVTDWAKTRSFPVVTPSSFSFLLGHIVDQFTKLWDEHCHLICEPFCPLLFRAVHQALGNLQGSEVATYGDSFGASFQEASGNCKLLPSPCSVKD
jgi:hypothetical protein